MFKSGKNHNGYFNLTQLMAQVNHVIDILKGKTNGLAQGLFLFDNAPSHLKCATDAISATKMVKSAFLYIVFGYFVFLMSLKIPSISGRTS